MTARLDRRPAGAGSSWPRPNRSATLVSAGALAAGLPLLQRAPRGEPHPVLVLPGLMASDLSTRRAARPGSGGSAIRSSAGRWAATAARRRRSRDELPAAGRPAGRRARDAGEHRRLEPRRDLRPPPGPAGTAPGAPGHLAGLAVRRVGRRPRPAAGCAVATPAARRRRGRPGRRCAAAAGAEHGGVLAVGRRRRLAGVPSAAGTAERERRGAQQSPRAWATTPPSSGSSPTGWPSRATTGSRSSGRPGSGSARSSRPRTRCSGRARRGTRTRAPGPARRRSCRRRPGCCR